MKNKFLMMSLLLTIFIFAACGPAAETESPPTDPDISETESALEPVLEETQAPPLEATEVQSQPEVSEPSAPAQEDGYPPPPPALPTAEGYPEPPPPAATVDPYPEAVDGFIWMLLPVGIQCEDDAIQYNDLQDAVAGLTAVNASTGQSEITELMVCSACGCPTSAHYRVQVSVDDVMAARSLGWERE
jgi:predicted small lipoprotein YifL